MVLRSPGLLEPFIRYLTPLSELQQRLLALAGLGSASYDRLSSIRQNYLINQRTVS